MFRHANSISVIRFNSALSANAIYIRRCLASSKSNAEGANEDEIKAARQWLAGLDADTIRQKAVCDISFSRSSGPGGQNVNK